MAIAVSSVPWVSEGFFPGGGAPGDFSKILPGGPKVVKFVFSHLKLKKQPFVLKISKSRGAPPLSDAMATSETFLNQTQF